MGRRGDRPKFLAPISFLSVSPSVSLSMSLSLSLSLSLSCLCEDEKDERQGWEGRGEGGPVLNLSRSNFPFVCLSVCVFVYVFVFVFVLSLRGWKGWKGWKARMGRKGRGGTSPKSFSLQFPFCLSLRVAHTVPKVLTTTHTESLNSSTNLCRLIVRERYTLLAQYFADPRFCTRWKIQSDKYQTWLTFLCLESCSNLNSLVRKHAGMNRVD